MYVCGKATLANDWDLQPRDLRQSGFRGSTARADDGHTVTGVGHTAGEGLATTSTAASSMAPRIRLRDPDAFAPRASPRRSTGACSGRQDNGMPHSRAGHASRRCGRSQGKIFQIGCSWITRVPSTMSMDVEVDRRPTLEVCRGVGPLRPGTGRQRDAGHRTGGDEACPLLTWRFCRSDSAVSPYRQLITIRGLSRQMGGIGKFHLFHHGAFVARHRCNSLSARGHSLFSLQPRAWSH